MVARSVCRVCGRYGDAITFLRELYGLQYSEACKQLRIEPKKSHLEVREKTFIKKIALDPTEKWIEKAIAFVNWCHLILLDSPILLDQIQKRGFNIQSIKHSKLGFNSGDKNGRDFIRWRQDWGLKEETASQKLWIPAGIVIPTFDSIGRVIKLKVRRTSYESDMEAYELAKSNIKKPKWHPQKYVAISGSQECLSIYGNRSLFCVIVVESELDALLIQQEAGDLVYCIALGGSTRTPDLETHTLLQNTPQIFFCPDYDKAGAKAWIRWKQIFPNIKRLLTPSEKSPGDYFQSGGNIREWFKNNIQINHKVDVI